MRRSEPGQCSIGSTKVEDPITPSLEPAEDSVKRAAFLSRIVCLETAPATREVNEHQDTLRFTFVHITGSVTAAGSLRVVCAMDCDRTLYVCFGSTKGTADLFTSALVDQAELRLEDDLAAGSVDVPRGQCFHHGFGSCGNHMRLLRGLLRSKHPVYGSAKQLVFCGHSVGGALAHVALVKYMLGVLNNDRNDDLGEAIAIGFGAPHICNRSARDYLRSCSSGEIERRIFDICRADGRLHQFLKVVLVVGEQNVGKTSLLQCILRRCGRGQLGDTITVGHTRDMEVYSCQVPLSGYRSGNLLLVDSPGTSSNVRYQDKLAWHCLERVPDLCFVMVRFNGDVQEKDHELSREIAQRRVCASENQVLLVNHVDAVLHGKPKAPIWEELNPLKMQDMREDFALSSDIQRDNVLMTVLDNENLFEQEMDLLRERGVLTQEEATDTVMSILQNLFTD